MVKYEKNEKKCWFNVQDWITHGHSLILVQNTEGIQERKVSSDALKVLLRNITVVIVVVIPEHRLQKARPETVSPIVRGCFTNNLLRYRILNVMRSTYIHHFSDVFVDHCRVWFCGDTGGPVQGSHRLVGSRWRSKLYNDKWRIHSCVFTWLLVR